MAKSTSPLTARPRPMAARMPGESAEVVGVFGSTVAEAKALDQRPAAASTAARSPADGGELAPEALGYQSVHYGVCGRCPMLSLERPQAH